MTALDLVCELFDASNVISIQRPQADKLSSRCVCLQANSLRFIQWKNHIRTTYKLKSVNSFYLIDMFHSNVNIIRWINCSKWHSSMSSFFEFPIDIINYYDQKTAMSNNCSITKHSTTITHANEYSKSGMVQSEEIVSWYSFVCQDCGDNDTNAQQVTISLCILYASVLTESLISHSIKLNEWMLNVSSIKQKAEIVDCLAICFASLSINVSLSSSTVALFGWFFLRFSFTPCKRSYLTYPKHTNAHTHATQCDRVEKCFEYNRNRGGWYISLGSVVI